MVSIKKEERPEPFLFFILMRLSIYFSSTRDILQSPQSLISPL